VLSGRVGRRTGGWNDRYPAVHGIDVGARFGAFDRSEERLLDDVRAWPSVEPAIDFTSTRNARLALAATTR
jgi:hypothetical protein